MKVEWRSEPGSRAVLEIDVPEEAVVRAMDQAFASLGRRVQVPGFRRGKAPRAILERHVGAETIREEALRRLVPEQYSAAVTEAGLDPISRPSIEVKEDPASKGLHLVATVDVYPKLALPDYHALRAAPDSHPLTDDDVDRALEDLRARQGRLVSAGEEPARRGDFVLLTVTAAPSGLERLQPGRELLVEIGGGLLPAAVEEALEGARAGDDRTARANEAGDVTVHVGDVRRKELPALDDAFARTVSDQPTLAALRELLRSRLAAERAADDARALRERVLDVVLAQTAVELPESLVRHELEHMLEDLADRLKSRGLTLDAYVRSAGKDDAGLRTEMQPAAERRVRTRLLLEAVAAREGLAVSEQEMSAEVEKLAGELNQDVTKVQAWLAEGSRREGLRENILRRNAMALLVDAVAGSSAAVGAAAALAQASGTGQDPAAETPGEAGPSS